MTWTVEQHAARIADLLRGALDRGTERVPLDAALARVIASDVLSPVDLPLFRNSQMDGYAVRAADVPGTLPVAGVLAAGPADPLSLPPGAAMRIMTGAMIPEGADAVVPVEDTAPDGDLVAIARGREPGEYVRERGSDLAAGSMLLPAGRRLESRHLAVLAAAGLTHIDVRAQVRIAVVTTGTEVVPPGDEPAPGQLFDANGTALVAAIRAAGALAHSRTHVPDDGGRMLAALGEATSADLVITSGGISMGDFEVVREVLEPRGAEVGSVAMQPGGPQATAVFQGTPVVCFPGNPVSTQVSFEVFLAPLLRPLAGLPPAARDTRPLASALRSPAGRRQFLRGRLRPDGSVETSGSSSHLVAGLAAADVLVVVPEDVTELQAGDVVETWSL
jgi:molybdopterin molybdotransferase